MNHNGINYIPLSGSVVFNLKKEFLDTISSSFKSLNIYTVNVTDAFRRESGGHHGHGKAIDIHSVISNKGETVFHALNASYNPDKDIDFFYQIKSKLGPSLLEYFSPGVIYKNGFQRPNRFLLSSKATIQSNLAKKGKSYDEDIYHLDHLHLAVDSNSSSSFILVLGLGVILFLAYRFNQKKEEKEVIEMGQEKLDEVFV
jgi:hypothetical protein